MLELDDALAALDAPTAEEVRPAVEHLVGGPADRVPLSTVNQADLQHFLWWVLPDQWYAEDYDRHEIAWALGDLFEAAGVQRYADICRGRRTHEVLAAWRRGVDEGRQAADAAERAAGVRPPDTEALAFGEVMGPEESRVYAAAAQLLEEAVVAGRLDPAARGSRAVARRLVQEFIGAADPRFARPPATVVRLERATFWADRLGGGTVWGRLLPRLDQEPRDPVRADLAVTPAVALISAVGDGVALTKSGYLPPAVALELDARFGWSEEFGHVRPRGESQIPMLRFLHEHLREQRLLTRRGNRLTVSARGARLVTDPVQLWRALAAPAPRWRTGFEADAVAVTAALLLGEDGRSGDDLCAEAAGLIARKWHAPADDDVTAALRWVQIEWYRLGLVLDWWERRRGRLGTGRTLSPAGRAAAATAFWSVAGQPMRR